MADSDAVRAKRYRLHAVGDHSACKPGCERRLRVATDEDRSALEEAVAAEFTEADPLVRALALRLAAIAASGQGVAQVRALTSLGELTATQRGDGS